MKEVYGDLWTYQVPPPCTKVICITTNGDTNKHGLAVMGRGVAKQAADFYPGLRKVYGEMLKTGPLRCRVIAETGWIPLIAFPVKYHWFKKASLELISKSIRELEDEARLHKNYVFLLPRPGCGNGGLKWEQVKPLLKDLPDNVWVITNGEEE